MRPLRLTQPKNGRQFLPVRVIWPHRPVSLSSFPSTASIPVDGGRRGTGNAVTNERAREAAAGDILNQLRIVGDAPVVSETEETQEICEG